MRQPSDALVISKQLAWTMIAALVGTVFWFGQTLSTISGKIEALEEARLQSDLMDQKDAASMGLRLTDHEARIRPLEISGTIFSQKLDNLQADINEFGRKLDVIYRYANGQTDRDTIDGPAARP